MKAYSTLFLLSAATLGVGCKTQGTASENKSLDNFAGVTATVNDCSGTEASQAPQGAITGTEAQVAAVEKALSAVPASLQSEFFNKMGGKIAVGVVPEGCKLAGKASAMELDNEMIACFKQDEGKVTIHVAEKGEETSKNIGHALVRTFGYVASQVMLSYPSAEGGQTVKAQHLAMLERNLTIYANADMTKQGKYDIAVKFDDSVRENMFAEVFDSHYCSAETRASLKKNFPMTAAHFDEQFADQLDEALMDTQYNTGFGMWGRWGFGNGPLRQGFSNWLDWRASGRGLFNVRRWADGGGFVFQRPWFAPWRWGGNYYYSNGYYYQY